MEEFYSSHRPDCQGESVSSSGQQLYWHLPITLTHHTVGYLQCFSYHHIVCHLSSYSVLVISIQCASYHHTLCQLSSSSVSLIIRQCASYHHTVGQLSSYSVSVVMKQYAGCHHTVSFIIRRCASYHHIQCVNYYQTVC